MHFPYPSVLLALGPAAKYGSACTAAEKHSFPEIRIIQYNM
jgi:hypothetical protein